MNNGNESRIMNPNAREAMDKFKMEAANEVGVNLKKGYNGELTSRQAGSVGGQMVKVTSPVRSFSFSRSNRVRSGHCVPVTYLCGIAV